MKPTFGSLFAGIGGFDLGLERAGWRCAWQVEADAACRSVLRRHFPGVPIYDDVREVGSDLEPVDLVCGGFPCQDVSVAGRRAGLAGARSGLWWEFHRIVAALSPRWVLVENVAGLLSGCGCRACRAVGRIVRVHRRIRRRTGEPACAVCIAGERMLEAHSGRNLAKVIAGLANLGYVGSGRVLDSQHFGVAQRRRRVFLVGHLGAEPRPKVLSLAEGVQGHPPPSREAGARVAPILEIGARASGDNRRDGDGIGRLGDPMFTLQAGKQHGVAHSLRGEGFDASEDGTGRGTPLVVEAVESGHVVAFSVNQRREGRLRDVHGSLNGEGSGTEVDGVLDPMFVHPRILRNSLSSNQVGIKDDGLSDALTSEGPGAVMQAIPRRLTPLECERLQGFPDGWTEVQSDSARYRQLGNAVTVPVAEWIARRILAAHLEASGSASVDLPEVAG